MYDERIVVHSVDRSGAASAPELHCGIHGKEDPNCKLPFGENFNTSSY
jgi:hypothetical protein